MQYNLEIEKLIEEINKEKHKTILIQLADGLKPEAEKIADQIESETDASVLIWLGSCYGACDIPLGVDQLKVDLVVQWGHNFFKKEEGW